MKRLMDILLSGLALLVFSPLLILVVMGLRLTGEGQIFYRQNRVGKGGKPFKLLKFVTMLKNSPNLGSGLLTTKGDPRILPMGKFLRKTKLDELPQLINIFLGDMSVIGRRPQPQSHVDLIAAAVRTRILQAAPGLSGVGSIVLRDEEFILTNSPKGHERCFAEDIQPYKGQLELWYCEHQSLWLDIQLIVLTLCAIFSSDSKLLLKWLHDLPEPPQALQSFV